MAQFFAIHPTHPQARLVRRAADIVRGGGLIAYPTDSCYALGCERAKRSPVPGGRLGKLDARPLEPLPHDPDRLGRLERPLKDCCMSANTQKGKGRHERDAYLFITGECRLQPLSRGRVLHTR